MPGVEVDSALQISEQTQASTSAFGHERMPQGGRPTPSYLLGDWVPSNIRGVRPSLPSTT